MLSNYFRGKKYFLRVLATIMGVVMLSGIIPNSCFVQATDDSLSSDSLWEKAIRENYTSFNIDFNSTEGNPDKADGHVQGICVDDKMEYIYFSSSNALIKMDMKTQEIVADIQFGTLGFTEMYGLHLGCVDYYDGFIYGSLIAAKPYGKAYIVVIEADKMTERNMNGLTMQKDDGLSVVLLQDVVDDLRATMNYSEKNLDSEGGTSHYNENNGHLFGCSGIDGVTVGKMPGDTSEQIYLIVAENSFGGGIANGTRYDINNNRLLFYSMNELKVKMSDFKYDNCKKLDLTDDACVNVDDILHVWTGATQWGVQNLEYEWDTGDIVLYTYPNDSGFGKDMYVIDGNKVPEMKELQVGQYNTDIDSTVQAFAKESATYYKALKCYQSETLTDEGYPIVKYAVLKCICGDPAHHQYEDGDCWGDTGVLKTDYPICSSDCIHSGANLGIHWLDNDGDNIDYFYIVDNITNCVNVSLYKRVTAENGSFSISKVTGVMAQNIEGNTTEKLRNADGDGDYKKQEVDEYISTGTHPTSAENKVFAGWYLDSECTKPYNNQSDANSVYAKFIDANILSFKFQLTKDTTVASEKTNLRLITSVDSLQYKNVGFDVTINNSTKTFTSKTVYTSLKGYVNEQQTSYSPSVFSMDSKYFMAHTLENIPRSFFMETITVTPKWTTLDGTSVTGISRSFTINEILESGYNDLGWMEFEHSSDQMLIMKNDENPVHRRVAYTDVEVTPLASMGDYAFQIIGTGKTNPGGSMYSKTTYNTGAILNFMMYVETQNSNVTEKKLN